MVVYRKVPLEKGVGECRTVLNSTLLEGNGAEGHRGVLEGAGRHSTVIYRKVPVLKGVGWYLKGAAQN